MITDPALSAETEPADEHAEPADEHAEMSDENPVEAIDTGDATPEPEPGATVVHLTKAHGAGRAYLLYLDADGYGALSAEQVRELTDPVRGVPATAVVRIVPASVVGKAGAPWYLEATAASGAQSIISTGVLRAAAAYLHQRGELAVDEGDTISLVSPVGRHYVRYTHGDYAITLGAWRALGGKKTLDEGFNATVAVSGLDDPRPGLQLEVGATHTVVALSSQAELADLSFVVAPRVEPAPEANAAGAGSLAFVVTLGERDVDLTGADGLVIGTDKVGAVHVRYVTGSGRELLGDDFAAAAVAVAVRSWGATEETAAADEWVLVSPGGRQRVTIKPSRSVEVAEPITLTADIAWRFA